MIRVIIFALMLIGASVGAKAWLAQAPTTTPPPPAATIQDQQLIVLNGINGIQLVLN